MRTFVGCGENSGYTSTGTSRPSSESDTVSCHPCPGAEVRRAFSPYKAPTAPALVAAAAIAKPSWPDFRDRPNLVCVDYACLQAFEGTKGSTSARMAAFNVSPGPRQARGDLGDLLLINEPTTVMGVRHYQLQAQLAPPPGPARISVQPCRSSQPVRFIYLTRSNSMKWPLSGSPTPT